jgi:hypothetical protein
MKVKHLRALLENVPDDAVLLVESRDHGVREVAATVGLAVYDEKHRGYSQHYKGIPLHPHEETVNGLFFQ